MSQENIEKARKDSEMPPELNSLGRIMENAKRVLSGKAIRFFTAGLAAGTFYLADSNTSHAFSPDSLPSSAATATKIETEEDLPTEVVTMPGAVLQIHPLVPNSQQDKPFLQSQIFKVTGEKFDNYIVTFDGISYFLPKKYVLEQEPEADKAQEQIIETQYVVIKVAEGNARSAPDTSADNVVSKVHSGDKLEKTGEEIVAADGSLWHEVILPSQETAWVSSQIIDPVIITETEAVVGVEAPTPITTTVPITESAVVNENIIHPERIGGNVEDEQLLATAKEQLGAENIQSMTLVYDQPMVLNGEGEIVGLYTNSTWTQYEFPEDIRPTQAVRMFDEVKRLFPNATNSTFSLGVLTVTDENSNDIATVENGEIIPTLEYSLLRFIKGNAEFSQSITLDSIIVKTINGTTIAEVNNVSFIYLNEWKVAPPDIEAQLTAGAVVETPRAESENYLVNPDEVGIELNPGNDFEGKVRLTENAEQVVLETFAEAISQSDVLAPIMGSTKEEVITYLRSNNFVMPAATQLPYQLPRVFDGAPTHYFVQFRSTPTPVDLKNIRINFFFNDETAKFDNITDKIIWSGNTDGNDGVAMWIDNEGVFNITGVVKRRDLYDEEPEKLAIAGTKAIFKAVGIMAGFDGKTLAGGDENAFIESFEKYDALSPAHFANGANILEIVE